MLISRKYALSLLRQKKAANPTPIITAFGSVPEYIVIDRLDIQRVDYYKMSHSDLKKWESDNRIKLAKMVLRDND